MEEAFYRDRLKALGVEALTPDKPDRDRLHEIIYDELILGVVDPRSRALLLDVIDADRDRLGIDGVILGCTEFGLLIGQQDLSLPLIDTTVAHAEAGVEFLLSA